MSSTNSLRWSNFGYSPFWFIYTFCGIILSYDRADTMLPDYNPDENGNNPIYDVNGNEVRNLNAGDIRNNLTFPTFPSRLPATNLPHRGPLSIAPWDNVPRRDSPGVQASTARVSNRRRLLFWRRHRLRPAAWSTRGLWSLQLLDERWFQIAWQLPWLSKVIEYLRRWID